MKSFGAGFASWWSIVVVAVVSFSLGAWVARRGETPTPIAPQSPLRPKPPAPRARPAVEKPHDIARPMASSANDDAGLLAALRLRLADSKDDALQAVAEIARTQPARAIDLAQALGRTEEEKSEWVTNVMQQWADRDPQAAWAWLGGLTTQRMQEFAGGELTTVVLGAMAARDPGAVVTNLDRFLRAGNPSDAIATPTAMQAGLQALVDHGQLALARGALETWSADPSHLSIESAAFATVATAWGKSAPTDAGAWLKNLPASSERNQAIASFADAWAQNDPRAALQWVGALGSAEGQLDAINRIVSDCVESHPNAVGAWLGDYLSTAPDDASTDRLIETVINLSPAVRDAPSVALSWTQLIADPQQKERYAERVAQRWAQQDRAAALEFVQSTPLISPDRKPTVFQTLASGVAADAPRE